MSLVPASRRRSSLGLDAQRVNDGWNLQLPQECWNTRRDGFVGCERIAELQVNTRLPVLFVFLGLFQELSSDARYK